LKRHSQNEGVFLWLISRKYLTDMFPEARLCFAGYAAACLGRPVSSLQPLFMALFDFGLPFLCNSTAGRSA